VFEQIGPEIQHLEKGGSTVRVGKAHSKAGARAATIGICALLGLFFMDPFLYEMHKSTAIRAYVYLHSQGSDTSLQPLITSGIFSKDEIARLNKQRGLYQSDFSSTIDAETHAAGVVSFVNEMQALHRGDYEQLDPIGKLRYLIFVRIGLEPPTTWSGLNPSVD